jgi:hypothetical protein
MWSRPVVVATIIALSLAGPAAAASHNESCSHAEGTCRPSQHITTGLPSLLFDSDQALLGHIEKDFQSAAMRPASFPSVLPADVFGYSGSVINLPQPHLKRQEMQSPLTKHETPSPLSKGAATAGTMDSLGLF